MIVILLTYYNRPILLRRALLSVLDSHQHYKNWRILIGDDNSPVPAEPIAREVLGSHLERVDFLRSSTSIEEKVTKGTSIGKYANEYLLDTDADIVVTLGDDDRLHETYLRDLDAYYASNPSIMYAYSDIEVYNPITNSGSLHNHRWNVKLGTRNPSGVLDASQVSFRVECVQKHGVRFPEWTAIGDIPYAGNVDAPFYDQLYSKFGPCQHTGLLGQYKGVHDYQLVWHKKKGAKGIRNYIDTVNHLGGKVF